MAITIGITKYKVGDMFRRNDSESYSGYYLLLSHDLEGEPHNRFAWRVAWFPFVLPDGRIKGAVVKVLYEEDIDSLEYYKNIHGWIETVSM